MNPELKVYWRPGCSSCVKVKEYLAREGVAFESIDVSARPAKRCAISPPSA
jgi:glutaredoxin